MAHNKSNNTNFNDGHFWMYNSTVAFTEQFPEFSQSQIRRILDKLKELGLILTGVYNKKGFDRTTWYTVSEQGMKLLQKCQIDLPKSSNGNVETEKSICQNQQMDVASSSNGFDEISKPIPTTYQYTTQDNTNVLKKRFKKPSIEELENHILQNNLNVSAESFYFHYESVGWKVGKNNMKDWKMAVRSWHNRNKPKKSTSFDSLKEKEDNIVGVF